MNSKDYDQLKVFWDKYGYDTLRSHLDEWLDQDQRGPEKKQDGA